MHSHPRTEDRRLETGQERRRLAHFTLWREKPRGHSPQNALLRLALRPPRIVVRVEDGIVIHRLGVGLGGRSILAPACGCLWT